jgi:hypothetical protein
MILVLVNNLLNNCKDDKNRIEEWEKNVIKREK